MSGYSDPNPFAPRFWLADPYEHLRSAPAPAPVADRPRVHAFLQCSSAFSTSLMTVDE